MASSTPPFEWRLMGTLKKPKRPNRLFFYLFDGYGNVRDAVLSLIWKPLLVLFLVILFEAFLLFFNDSGTYFWITSCLSITVVGGFGLWLFFSDDWRTGKHSYEYDMEKYRRALVDYEEKLSILKQKHPFPIIGHEQFRSSVERVLDELQSRAPHRYREVIEYLPKAEYNSDLRFSIDWTQRADGRSDGYFSVDGAGTRRDKQNDYKRFRKVFLHEVGHNVCGKLKNDWSETAADKYAYTVLRELGVEAKEKIATLDDFPYPIKVEEHGTKHL